MITIQSIPQRLRTLRLWVREHLPTLLFGFIGLSSVLIVIFALLQFILGERVERSAPAVAVPQFNNREYRLRDITYSGAAVTIPAQLAIYRGETNQGDTKTYATTLANQLGLLKHPKLDNLWLSEDKTVSLGADFDRGYFTYGNNQKEPSSLRSDYDLAKAITAASGFLEDLGINTNVVKPVAEEITFISDHGEPIPVESRANAQYVNIPFAFLLSNYPVFMQQQNVQRLIVHVNNDYTVTKAIFFPYTFESVEQDKLVATLSIQEAIEQIRNGNYTVINVSQTRGDFTMLDNFSEVNFSQGQVEYRYLPDQQRFYPFYRFTGTGIAVETYLDVQQPEKAATLEIITPAINTTQTAETNE